MNLDRANLYQSLAEALVEPPEWLALQGNEWPLFHAAVEMATESEAAQRAVLEMAEIRPESIELRQKRYQSISTGSDRPLLWMNESGSRFGKLVSEITFDVEKWYRAAELDLVGTELPDHASFELAFLAYLSGTDQAEFSRFEGEFLQRHALRWLPALGRAIAESGDSVYAPIGRLLADWLEEINPHPDHLRKLHAQKRSRWIPTIPPGQVEDCILCGFCAQVCPTEALVMRENQHTTGLQLSEKLCIGCRRCVQVCEPHVLTMDETSPLASSTPEIKVLRRSQRANCKSCGKPLISQAELAYLAACLGDPTWLELCQECRPG